MAILKIKDDEGKVHEILAVKGEKGDAYVLTDADKQEIAEIVKSSAVSTVDMSSYLTEEQVLALIQANMPVNGDEESY